MNTKTLETVVQARVCHKLAFLRGDRAGHTMGDLNREVSRQCNRVLIEQGLNGSLWSRQYRDRVFIYHMKTRRAMLELGIVTSPIGNDRDGVPLYKGFELVIMGGIYNQVVTDDLVSYTVAQPLKRR